MSHQKWKIEIPIYEYTLVLYTGDNMGSIVQQYKLENDLGDYYLERILAEEIWAITFSTTSDICIAIPFDAPASIIAHEATHVINMIFDEIGYETRPDNDESFTYFLTWLIDKIDAKLALKRPAPVTPKKRKKKNKPSKQRVRNR